MKAVQLSTAIAFAVLVGASTAALADSAKETVRLRRVVTEYAACVVKAHHAKASEAILATTSNRLVIERFSQILDSSCLASATGGGVDMRFSNGSYLDALADALVNQDFATRGYASFNDRLPLAQPIVASAAQQTEALAKIRSGRGRKELQDEYDKQQTLSWVSSYGECVVRENPEAARYWLLTRPDTPEETSRIKALTPAFSACLGKGTIKFSRLTMRGTVAINYYRLAMATVVPVAGSTH